MIFIPDITIPHWATVPAFRDRDVKAAQVTKIWMQVLLSGYTWALPNFGSIDSLAPVATIDTKASGNQCCFSR